MVNLPAGLVTTIARVVRRQIDVRTNNLTRETDPQVVITSPIDPHVTTRLALGYKAFQRELNESWEAYLLLQQLRKPIHNIAVRTHGIKVESFVRGPIKRTRTLTGSRAAGVVDKLVTTLDPRKTLVDVVAQFEAVLDEVALHEYTEFVERELRAATAGGTSVFSVATANAIRRGPHSGLIVGLGLERGLVNVIDPSRIFATDRLSVGLGDHMQAHHAARVAAYIETTARRNAISHNQNRADYRYLAVSGSAGARLGSRLQIDEAYLSLSFSELRHLAACAVAVTIRRFGGMRPSGKVGSAYKNAHWPP